eukprot:GILK01002507.1.p1 GENE.GILK01002507.1~~GILK01002507.1.p1  ORF type:complete len:159 (-),score=21.66 GILK01002507.1:137-565(-)
MSAILFQDTFEVKQVNAQGKKFVKVDRFEAKSDLYEMDIVLDINSDVYPVEPGEQYLIAFATTLNNDGSPDSGAFDQNLQSSLLDKFEYCMYGKVYKYAEEARSQVTVYVSYGGLLMSLKGDPKHLAHFDVDSRIFLLMKRV